MAEILGATDGEIIDSLREDLLAALQEIARLEAENARLTRRIAQIIEEAASLMASRSHLLAENARLKAPVSDEEWLDNSVCESHDYRNRANRRQVNALIAARSSKEETNHG